MRESFAEWWARLLHRHHWDYYATGREWRGHGQIVRTCECGAMQQREIFAAGMQMTWVRYTGPQPEEGRDG